MIPSDIGDAMVRLEVISKEGARARIDENRISEKLKGSFHYGASWKEEKVEKIGVVDFTLDPLQLFRDFVVLNYDDHPKKDELLDEGEAILREVLH
jgi:hypothetical protein